MRLCNNPKCRRETKDDKETTCIICGWRTVSVEPVKSKKADVKPEEPNVNGNRH